MGEGHRMMSQRVDFESELTADTDGMCGARFSGGP